jgi:hypothetical protein
MIVFVAAKVKAARRGFCAAVRHGLPFRKPDGKLDGKPHCERYREPYDLASSRENLCRSGSRGFHFLRHANRMLSSVRRD